MQKNTNIPVSRTITILVMCFCLLFLTGVNFFIYPASQSFCSSIMHGNNASDEESPVEEKSSSKTGITVQEEYIHEHHIAHLSAFVVLSGHKIPPVEKLQVVHFELDAPPPKI